MMTGLTELHLANNIIDKIENLDYLVNLTNLDLSFNRIKVIENLENLKKIEILTLFENCISRVENLDCLQNLEIFSIGNNYIEDESCVLYLRKFKKLRSLNLSGNPCVHEGLAEYIAVFIPQLIYYEYKQIKVDGTARSKYWKNLTELENQEALGSAEEQRLTDQKLKEAQHAEAFVEKLDGDQLCEAMLEHDPNGQTLLLMGEEAVELFNSFQEQVREVTKDIFELGQEQLNLRKNEQQQFNQCVQLAKTKSLKDSRQVVESFIESKNEIFTRIQERIARLKDKDVVKKEVAADMGAHITEFNALCKRTWKTLMRIELVLFEQMEELNLEFKKNLGDMVSQFVEVAQVLFTSLHEHEKMFMEALQDLASRYITHLVPRRDDLAVLPAMLSQIMMDKETMNNALTTSHETHMRVIDSREDQLISRVRHWHCNLCSGLQFAEIARNRATVLEINHFLDKQKEEFELLNMDFGEEDMFLEDDNIICPSTARSSSFAHSD